MSAMDMPRSGRASARDVTVWDPLVRLIHWVLALTILLNGAFTDPEGNLHVTVGYVSLGLVGTRLLWGWIGTRAARFSAFPPNPVAAIRHLQAIFRQDAAIHLSHNPLGALMVYNIWLSVIILGATGIMMGMIRFFGMEWVEEMHEAVFNWLVLSVAVHVAGVAFDTWRTGVPLARAMITGRKRIPQGRKVL